MCIYLLFFQGKSFCSNPREILPKESEPKTPSRLPTPTFNHDPKDKELNLLRKSLPNMLNICQNLAQSPKKNLASPKKNLPKPEDPPSPVRRSPSAKPPQLNYTKRPKSRYENFGLFWANFYYNLKKITQLRAKEHDLL